MEDLIQVLFFLLIVIFGLIGGSKKKKQAPAPRSRTAERASAEGARARAASGARSRPVPARRAPETREELEASLYDLLRGRGPEPPVREPPARELPEAPAEEEARSLETLTPAGEASHRRFHERYIDVPVAAPEARRRIRIIPSRVDAPTLREAMVWHEILGRPKGLD